MNRPALLEGCGVALAASLTGSLLFALFSPMIGSDTLLRLLIAGLGFGYILYLMRRSGQKTGRLLTLAAWSVSTLLIGLLVSSLPLYLLLHIGLVWLIRSFYFHSSLFPAIADLGLSGLGAAAIVWALLQSGSLLLAIWCYFLLQAFFSTIPTLGRPATGKSDQPERGDRFRRAEQAAEAALRKLSSTH
ncbi:MAG: hypothetical protein OQL28_08860 [Sedimenticola sp.]|nr:hypothetical protein [Sedimenticola sp.]